MMYRFGVSSIIGTQAYQYRRSVEHLVGEAMRSLVTLNWKSRATSWLGVEVGEGAGNAEAAVARLLVVGLVPRTALRASAS